MVCDDGGNDDECDGEDNDNVILDSYIAPYAIISMCPQHVKTSLSIFNRRTRAIRSFQILDRNFDRRSSFALARHSYVVQQLASPC